MLNPASQSKLHISEVLDSSTCSENPGYSLSSSLDVFELQLYQLGTAKQTENKPTQPCAKCSVLRIFVAEARIQVFTENLNISHKNDNFWFCSCPIPLHRQFKDSNKKEFVSFLNADKTFKNNLIKF